MGSAWVDHRGLGCGRHLAAFLFSVEFGDLWDVLGDFINMLMTKAVSVIICQCCHTIEICLNLINTGQIRVAIDLNT